MTATLRRGTGRFWSPDSPWNTPVADDAPWLTGPVQLGVVDFAPIVVYPHSADPFLEVADRGTDDRHRLRVPVDLDPLPPDGTIVLADLATRTVASGTEWTYDDESWTVTALDVEDLDGPGWGASLAAGLVLERELLTGTIDHCVGVYADDVDLYGLPFRLDPAVKARADWGAEVIIRALQGYGAMVVGIHDEPGLTVRCERSATAHAHTVGETYRRSGIGRDRWPVVA